MSAVGLRRRLESHAALHPESAEVIGDALALIAELFETSAALSAALPQEARRNRMQLFSDEFSMFGLARLPQTTGCEQCGVGPDDECSMDCPSRTNT